MSKKVRVLFLFIIVIAIGWGIGKYTIPSASEEQGAAVNQQDDLQGQPAASPKPTEIPGDEGSDKPDNAGNSNTSGGDVPAVSTDPAVSGNGSSEQTAAKPDSITVMVNKQYGLPDNYKPEDLVYPNVRFTFKEKIEKRMMRKEAASALEELFAGAQKDGIYLAGVSAYRSQSTQVRLFNNYVKRDGEEKARRYSAVPGHSEHQTGLAIDVTSSDGKCAAESCFAGTPEAKWLAEHAAEYGYIIRYPEGKENITGYMYEPWHIRYVGKEIAADIVQSGVTLEEYYNAVPVSQ
ncbi:D-alanyl-D-alanine carboxypeptidase family protein [Paenibacillus sp. NPDC056722]|uniref:M15 family metallopeptidase n=1 Tax=Paenibacillus sp. NPDC056722 TaxID=3345924 RepID=UPI0036BD0AE4